MPSAEENYLLMWCIIEQKMDDKGTLTLDWEKITTKMGSDNVGSTKSRWIRLRADFQKMGFMKGPEAVDLAAFKAQAQAQAPKTKTPKAATTPKPKKTANPKARSAVEKKGAAKAKGKKSKAEVEEDDDQKDDAEAEEVESDANVERMKEDGSDEEET